MAVLKEYTYEPLCAQDAKRILRLEPAESSDAPLRCSITQHLPAELEEYAAVSYCWGDAQATQLLEVRSGDGISCLRIRKNVDDLLRQLRAPKEVRRLWIDAICLNQNDQMEKAHQIPRMRSIYGEAREVHIWLGLADDTTEYVFTFLKKASGLPMEHLVTAASNMEALLRGDDGDAKRIARKGVVRDFFNRPWFSRRWVIQEACLAAHATVHCGPFSMVLPELVRSANRIQYITFRTYPIKMASRLFSQRGPSTDAPGLLELLWEFDKADCTEPKDRIAAVIGLISDKTLSHLAPEVYSEHWTEFYKHVAHAILRQADDDTGLQFLHHLLDFGPVTRADTEDPFYPSWVPNWSKPRMNAILYIDDERFGGYRGDFVYYPTSPGHGSRTSLTSHEDVLELQWEDPYVGLGSRVIGYAKTLETSASIAESKTEQVIEILQEIIPGGPNQFAHLHALFRLLNRSLPSGSLSKDSDVPCSHRNESVFKKHPYMKDSLKIANEYEEFELGQLVHLEELLQSYCMFGLEKGNSEFAATAPWGFGIGSPRIKAGDILVPLWGIHERPNLTSWYTFRPRGPTLQTVTMLAVRRVTDDDGTGRGHAGILGEGGLVGRVIGPAICIVSGKPLLASSRASRLGRESNRDIKSSHQCSIRLI